MIQIISTLLTFIFYVYAADPSRTIFAVRPAAQGEWSTSTVAPDPSAPFSFSVLLNIANQSAIENSFEDISNPSSPNYRKFLSPEQIQDMLRPTEEAFAQTYRWLSGGVENITAIQEGISHIKVTTNVATASLLLQTEFRMYTNVITSTTQIRAFGECSHPSFLKPFVHMIAGVSELLTPQAHAKVFNYDPKKRSASLNYDTSFPITPSALHTIYNASESFGQSSETLQGVMAFSSFYSSSALQSFVEKYNFSMGNVTDLGSNCLATGCNQAESNLDMQYITATAPNVSTIFIASPSNYWILEAMEELIMKMNKVPQVLSISYGTPEFLQCGTHDYCRTLGYSTSLYLSRSQIYFQALGIQGTSIIVASGDDGAMGFSPQTGNNPTDNSTYCYNGGCSHSSSQCQQVRLASGSQSVIFPTFYLSSSSAAITNAVNAWALNNTKCNVTIENGYLYSSCPCQQLKYGVYSGVNVSLYERYSQRFGQAFTPSWPASDPYVTSVGATIFREGSGEEVASIKNGALVTSGGGFSQTFSTPAYQQRAVDNWMARAKMEGTLPPNGTFSSTMRGFPDISFAGHAFVVYQQNADGSSVETYVDGTSASAPAFSGFISALNDKLMLRGDRPMGFLNPLLYLVAQTRPDIYNDITVGDNKCTTSECYVHGYEATEGWDPASGLGSVNIGKLFEYVLQVTANETISQLVNSQTPMSTEMGTNGADAPMPTDPLATMNQQQNNESGRSNLVSAAWVDAPKWAVMVVALILACTM